MTLDIEIRRRVSVETGDASRGLDPGLPSKSSSTNVVLRLDQPLVILLDQFEELFLRHEEDVSSWVRPSPSTAALRAREDRLRLLISIRDEFLARLWEFREQIPNVLYNGLRLEPLPRRRPREAIVEPPRLFGIGVEAGWQTA